MLEAFLCALLKMGDVFGANILKINHILRKFFHERSSVGASQEMRKHYVISSGSIKLEYIADAMRNKHLGRAFPASLFVKLKK